MKGAFIAAVLVLCGTIVVTRPPLRDPDSTLYAAMSSQLAARSLDGWLTPEWPAGRAKTGRFVEHSAVSLWPGAFLERIGLPSGAVLANALCALLLLWLVGKLAETLSPGAEATAWLAWGCSLIGVQYWLRANHEIWWAAAALAALLGVAARWPRWCVVACTLIGCSIKGALGLDTVLLVVPLAWVVHGRRWVALYVLFSALAVAAFVALYDVAYRGLAGESFVRAYLSTQLGYVIDSETSGWLIKPRNLVVYVVKLAWFSLSGALLLAWSLRKRALTPELRALVAGLLLVLLATSLMSRQAGRYIFPCYPVLAVIGAASSSFSLQARRTLVFGAVLLVALGRLLFASVVYREINLLPGTRVDQSARARLHLQSHSGAGLSGTMR